MQAEGCLMIRSAKASDWPLFHRMADDEGWRVPQFELRQFLGPWSSCAWALEIDQAFSGLVTAVPYERSGWIGNLIVSPRLRGRGYGDRLFRAASETLANQGVTLQCLTASQQGRPLYEKYGFVTVDTIERWASPGRGPAAHSEVDVFVAEQRLRCCERSAWGEQRASLLDGLVAHGRIFACDDAVALLQQDRQMQVLGPWYAPNACPRANRRLLQEVLAAADTSIEVVADTLSSSPLRPLLLAAGFERCGETVLMMKGDLHVVNMSMMVTLASLGSVG